MILPPLPAGLPLSLTVLRQPADTPPGSTNLSGKEDGMAQTFTKQSISHDTAQKMVAAAVAQAQELGVPQEDEHHGSHRTPATATTRMAHVADRSCGSRGSAQLWGNLSALGPREQQSEPQFHKREGENL